MIEQVAEFLLGDTEIDSIRDFILSYRVDETELNDAQRIVAASISLRSINLRSMRHRFEVCTGTEQIIVEHLARALYYAAKYQSLPIPDKVEFIQGKRGVPDRNINHGAYALAENTVTPKCPNGLISYSAYYLKTEVVDFLEGFAGDFDPSDSIQLLAGLSSHEMRHMAQRRDSPLEFDRECGCLR